MPIGSVAKLSGRVLHGPNRWSRLPMVHVRVDLGALEASPTERIPGFSDRLMSALPGLVARGADRAHRDVGRPGYPAAVPGPDSMCSCVVRIGVSRRKRQSAAATSAPTIPTQNVEARAMEKAW